MRYRGVIFDFNGTMFFDEEKHLQAWRELGNKWMGRPVSDEEILPLFGASNLRIFRYFLGENFSSERACALGEEKERIYRALCKKDAARCHLAEGVEELLDFLKERNIPRTIATGSPVTSVTFYFEEFGLEKWFRPELVVCDDGTLAGKPDPEIYLRAAKKIGLAPGHCIVAEDAALGFQAARAAGIGRIVAVEPPAKHAWAAAMEGVDEVITDFTEFDRTMLNWV